MANVSKRSHKDSSDSEEEIKKRRNEEPSEDEEDEENDEEEEDEENDEEIEVEMDAVSNVTLPAVKWSVEDSHRLLVSITFLLPQCDVELYSEQEAKIDWEKVAFGSFSAGHCRQHWHELTKKVRVYRTMSDMVTDALSLLPRPASSFQMIQKNNQRHQKKPIAVKKKSSLPKFAVNAFGLFMKEKIQTLQHIPSSERMKHISQLYKLLNEKEKNELLERYEELKKNHIKVLKKLKEDSPALAEEIDEQVIKLEKIPGKSKKPKVSVVNQNNSILKYMSKEKTTPAQTVGASDRKSDPTSGRSPKKSSSMKSASTPLNSKNGQSSDDFAKRSESKIKSTMAAEDSSASNSSEEEEESYLSSARSIKKSSPVKPASKPKKSKAIMEKDSVSDHSGSEDEEHKQRSRSPKKSHSAEISAKKESMQMTSLKPLTKPGNGLKTSESKRKEKKKRASVTGLSQFVAAKKARYQQMYPELNNKEIVMKMAGKWERLSDKKKNKYEKLALQKMSSEEVD